MSSASSTPNAEDPGAYRHTVTSEVRFGDLDAMGHLNNVALLRLLETGRVDYIVDLELGTHRDLTYVLASLGVEFTAQSFYRDLLVCGSRTGRIGRTSLVLEQRVWRAHDAVQIARAQSVMVALGEDARTPVPVPEGWRTRIRDWEPIEVVEGSRA